MTHFTNSSFYFSLFWRLGVSENWNYSHTTYSSIACPFSWLREGGKRNFWPWPVWVRNHIFFACIGQRGICETYINFVYMEVTTTGDTVGGANGLTFQNNKMKPSPNKFISDTFAKHAYCTTGRGENSTCFCTAVPHFDLNAMVFLMINILITWAFTL